MKDEISKAIDLLNKFVTDTSEGVADILDVEIVIENLKLLVK